LKRRWVEYALLFTGLVAIDYFVWVNATSDLTQAYESWSFERDLRGEQSSLAKYLRDQWNMLAGHGTAPPLPPPVVTDLKEPTPVAPQSVIGRVEIPRLKLSVMIREGVDTGTLQRAVGHVPSTSLPGGVGNVALAAHRDTYFLPLEHIEHGDHIQVETHDGSYEYVVESTQVVTPKDVWVLKAADHPTLTLVTCYPFHYIGAAPKRFIVRAAQVGVSAANSRVPSGS
jgi:sortase A